MNDPGISHKMHIIKGWEVRARIQG
jgi:hypothetical protein